MFQSQKAITALPDFFLYIKQRTSPKDVHMKQMLSLQVGRLRIVGPSLT